MSGVMPSRAINSRRRGLADASIREGAVNPAALIAGLGRPDRA